MAKISKFLIGKKVYIRVNNKYWAIGYEFILDLRKLFLVLPTNLTGYRWFHSLQLIGPIIRFGSLSKIAEGLTGGNLDKTRLKKPLDSKVLNEVFSKMVIKISLRLRFEIFGLLLSLPKNA